MLSDREQDNHGLHSPARVQVQLHDCLMRTQVMSHLSAPAALPEQSGPAAGCPWSPAGPAVQTPRTCSAAAKQCSIRLYRRLLTHGVLPGLQYTRRAPDQLQKSSAACTWLRAANISWLSGPSGGCNSLASQAQPHRHVQGSATRAGRKWRSKQALRSLLPGLLKLPPDVPWKRLLQQGHSIAANLHTWSAQAAQGQGSGPLHARNTLHPVLPVKLRQGCCSGFTYAPLSRQTAEWAAPQTALVLLTHHCTLCCCAKASPAC